MDPPAQPPPPPASAEDREDWRYGIRLALHLATAHHPLCDWFQSDTYRVSGRLVCRGCAAALPTLVLGLVTAVLLLATVPIHPYTLGALGLLFGIPHGTTYLRRYPPGYRAFAKLSGGFGLGWLIPAILLAPLPLALRLALLGGLGFAFLALQLVRMKKILATCDACPWRRDWARCPGFATTHPARRR